MCDKIKKVKLNPFSHVAKKIAHWFIYCYDIIGYSKFYVDKQLNEILKCFSNEKWFKTAVAIQIISERRNIKIQWTKMERVHENYLYIKNNLDKLLKEHEN